MGMPSIYGQGAPGTQPQAQTREWEWDLQPSGLASNPYTDPPLGTQASDAFEPSGRVS